MQSNETGPCTGHSLLKVCSQHITLWVRPVGHHKSTSPRVAAPPPSQWSAQLEPCYNPQHEFISYSPCCGSWLAAFQWQVHVVQQDNRGAVVDEYKADTL